MKNCVSLPLNALLSHYVHFTNEVLNMDKNKISVSHTGGKVLELWTSPGFSWLLYPCSFLSITFSSRLRSVLTWVVTYNGCKYPLFPTQLSRKCGSHGNFKGKEGTEGRRVWVLNSTEVVEGSLSTGSPSSCPSQVRSGHRGNCQSTWAEPPHLHESGEGSHRACPASGKWGCTCLVRAANPVVSPGGGPGPGFPSPTAIGAGHAFPSPHTLPRLTRS